LTKKEETALKEILSVLGEIQIQPRTLGKRGNRSRKNKILKE